MLRKIIPGKFVNREKTKLLQRFHQQEKYINQIRAKQCQVYS